MNVRARVAPGARVLHLTHSLSFGGKERVVVELARTGRQAGHDDRILTFDRAYSGAEDELVVDDVPVEHLQRSRGFSIGYIRRMRALFASLRVQVVHAHNASALVYAALARRGMRRDRPLLVATWHNQHASPGWQARMAARWAANRADHVLCVSAQLRDRLQSTGWIPHGDVIHNGVDTAAFAPEGPARDLRAELGIPAATTVLGMHARFAPPKGQHALIEAGRAARRQGHDLALVFAGDGPTLEACRAGTRDGEPVHFLSQVQDVPAFLRGLDAYAFVSSREGLPMALLEAMACGLPVVATGVGGIPELVTQDTGILLSPDDPAALAEALGDMRDAARRAALGRAARERAVARFALRETAAEYEKLYASRSATP